MLALKRLIGVSLFVFALASNGLAQGNDLPVETPRERSAAATVAPLVTVRATATRVRFVAPGTVVQLRLEVYDETGVKVFDTELRGGNVLDWHLQNGAGERLRTGAYASVMTIKSLSGRLSQRVGVIRVNDQEIAFKAGGDVGLSAAQLQSVGPVEENAAFAIRQESDAEALTAVTHTGADGQLTSTKGALTFGTGDVLSGKDTEQMRLTEAGNLGIGTVNPQAKLDVAGVIRTSEGIEFASTDGTDGTKVTKLTTTPTGGLQQTLPDGTLVPNATGTGTQNRIAKWTDNAGTLGDSLLNESGGAIEVRSPAAGTGVNPTILNPNNVPGFAQFQFYPLTGPNTNMSFTVVPRGTGATNNRAQFSIFNTDLFADATNYEFAAMRARGSDFVLGTGKSGTGQTRPMMLAAGYLNDNVTNNGQLYLATSGNVGISNTNPTAKLDVVGNINTTTQYNIGGNRVLSNGGSFNLFAGAGTGTNTTGNNNSFFGSNVGPSNTFGANNSFFGAQTGFVNTGSENSFFGRIAGFRNTSGSSNSFFGVEAGDFNTTGFGNSAFGTFAGMSNTTENNNSFFGFSANGVAGITNATAIGSRASVTQSNSLVLGSINGVNGATADTNVGIGKTNPSSKLDVVGNINTTTQYNIGGSRVLSVAGTGNLVAGVSAGAVSTGSNNSFVGASAGQANTTGASNSFFGGSAGLSNTTEDNNTFAGYSSNGASGITNATAVGFRASVTQSNSLVLGSINGVNGASSDTSVGIGTTAPKTKLHVAGGTVYIAQSNSLIMKSPNGTCWVVAIDDFGVLSVTSTPCP